MVRFEELLRRLKIRDLPRRKVCRVLPTTSLSEVYRLLDEEGSVAVLVCDDGGRLEGIFTERDVLHRTALETDPATPIGELMVRNPVTASPDLPLAEAIRLMAEKRIRHLPLVDAEGRAAGMIGGRDVLARIAEQHPEALLNLPPRLDQRLTRKEGG